MNYFPLFARIAGLPCLIVGGGSVGTRKARQLLKAGAHVTVCAPEYSDELAALAREGRVRLLPARFTPDALTGMQFAVAATPEAAVNRAVATAAAERRLFCNVVDDRELSTAIFPAVVDRSPVIVAVSSGGAAPVLATRIRQQIDALLPAGLGDLATLMGRWRGRVRRSIATLAQRRAFWRKLLDSPAAEAATRGDTAAADAWIAAQLERTPRTAADQQQTGMAFIVGAGPGDPELLTLKALRALQDADVVLHDRLVAPAILEFARRDAEFISVGKQSGKPAVSQDAINALLVRLVKQGRRVCRIKGGDPFIFGRGGEEIDALEDAGLPWQVIPGITAAAGCAAAAGIPLTHREVARAVTLATARHSDDDEPDWRMLAGREQTLVLYMGLRGLAATCAALTAAGRDAETPAVVIQDGTTAGQRLVKGNLSDLPERVREAGLRSPALLIVGAVAAKARIPEGPGQTANRAARWSTVAANKLESGDIA